MAGQSLNRGWFVQPNVVQYFANWAAPNWAAATNLAANAPVGDARALLTRRAAGLYDIVFSDTFPQFLSADPSVQPVNNATAPSVLASATFWTAATRTLTVMTTSKTTGALAELTNGEWLLLEVTFADSVAV